MRRTLAVLEYKCPGYEYKELVFVPLANEKTIIT